MSDISNALEQARAQVRSIVELVDALDVDYNRLEELRELRASHTALGEGFDDLWPETYEEEAEELEELENQANGCATLGEAYEAIYEHPLSIEYRSGWTLPGQDMEPDEYRVVLCTGGPHVELRGTIGDGHVRVIWRGWGETGEYFPSSEEQDALQQYVTALGIHDTY